MIVSRYKLLGVLVAFLLSGCNSWLDVEPYDKMTEDQVYASEQGIQKNLNGLYLKMASEDLYARELSCGVLDVLAQRYYISDSEHSYYKLSRYQYTDKDVKPFFESIWSAGWSLVTACNEILENVPKHQEVLSKRDYALVIGEALAVRTYMQFDIFRLFAPVYSAETENRAAIPLYDKPTDVPASILTCGEVANRLISDIDSAIYLLQQDPILTDGIVLDDEDFWAYRNVRMNYYAAWGLKARMCWYLGVKYRAEAYRIATSLLEGKDPKSGATLKFGDTFEAITKDNAVKDRVYFPEMLFCLHNLNRDRLYKEMFSQDLESKVIFQGLTSYLGVLYNDNRDYRNRFWEQASGDEKVKIFVRFYPQTVLKSDKNPYTYQIQSLMRMSELYLIAAATASEEELQKEWLEKSRLNRGYQDHNMDGQDVNDILDKEWQREFYGEGQYFFYLKRNQVSILYGQDGNTKYEMKDYYQIPLPESEVNNRYE